MTFHGDSGVSMGLRRGAHSTFKDLAQRPKPLYFILRTSPALLKYLIIFDQEKLKSSTNNSNMSFRRNHQEPSGGFGQA